MKIKLHEYVDGDAGLLEEFEISKFEDLENKIYGYGKDLMINEKSGNILFKFDALENSPNGNYNGPKDPGRFWDIPFDDALFNLLIDLKLINSYSDDKARETEEGQKFIGEKKLDDESDRRELAKRFIELLL